MRQKNIRLHWAHSKPNFGDCLSPLICELISQRKVVHAKINKCDLIAAGSLLQRKKESLWTPKMNIWGTGFIEKSVMHKSKHIYHAIRGRFSASLLSNKSISVFGDPGLLADQLINPTQISKRYEIGIVPHYKDRDLPIITQLKSDHKGVKIIDVFQDPKEVITQIAQCHSILSSSLHGLITADSLNIPNIRIEISSSIRGGDWKFNDYYSIFGIEPLKISGDCLNEATELNPYFEQYNRPRLNEIKDELYKSFPKI
jgi:pyruvyltransferase